MTQLLERPLLSDYEDFGYWTDFAPDNPGAPKLDATVKSLAHVALGYGEAPTLPNVGVIETAPPLQAEAWYCLSGPLKSFHGHTALLSRAANVMESRPVYGETRTAQLELDTAYILDDIALNSLDAGECKDAISRALKHIKSIEDNPSFNKRPAIYRLQTAILKNDLEQTGTRLMLTGSTQPQRLENTKARPIYRAFEKASAELDKAAIKEFKKLVKGGISDENVGILVEWYFILARRHAAWADENLDTVLARGATSRENGIGWTSTDGTVYKPPKGGNHDVVISSYREGREPQTDRFQLKAFDDEKTEKAYDPGYVTVLNISQILGKGINAKLDAIVQRMENNLTAFAADYTQ